MSLLKFDLYLTNPEEMIKEKMYRKRLEELGVGTKIRIAAQYQHKAYGRLLLLKVIPLEEYLSLDDIDADYTPMEEWGWNISPINPSILTDHVHLDIIECDDKRLTEYIQTKDIVICDCEIYKYQYNQNSYGCYESQSFYNFAINNPCNIEVLRPVAYNHRLYFIPLNKDTYISHWRYTGQGSRACILSNTWDFTQIEDLAREHESTDFDGNIIEHKGYKIVETHEHYLSLEYEEKNSKIDIYKSIKDYCSDLKYPSFETISST